MGLGVFHTFYLMAVLLTGVSAQAETSACATAPLSPPLTDAVSKITNAGDLKSCAFDTQAEDVNAKRAKNFLENLPVSNLKATCADLPHETVGFAEHVWRDSLCHSLYLDRHYRPAPDDQKGIRNTASRLVQKNLEAFQDPKTSSETQAALQKNAEAWASGKNCKLGVSVTYVTINYEQGDSAGNFALDASISLKAKDPKDKRDKTTIQKDALMSYIENQKKQGLLFCDSPVIIPPRGGRLLGSTVDVDLSSVFKAGSATIEPDEQKRLIEQLKENADFKHNIECGRKLARWIVTATSSKSANGKNSKYARWNTTAIAEDRAKSLIEQVLIPTDPENRVSYQINARSIGPCPYSPTKDAKGIPRAEVKPEFKVKGAFDQLVQYQSVSAQAVFEGPVSCSRGTGHDNLQAENETVVASNCMQPKYVCTENLPLQ